MDYLQDVIARLSAARTCGYHRDSVTTAEPAALSALALLAHGKHEHALPLLDWLVTQQSDDGCVGIDAENPTPGWCTAWATLAWHAAAQCGLKPALHGAARDRGVQWMLSIQGSQIHPESWLGHDSMIIGWPWVAGTHSWIEPTAMCVLTLKHCGHGEQPRTREAVRLLQDRLLAHGGCNYGNTIILDQELRPHLQPTGLALWALQGESDADGRLKASIEYLSRELSANTATCSLSYGLLGLAAQDACPLEIDYWLAAASRRTLARDPGSYPLALVALAALGSKSPLMGGAWQFEEHSLTF